VVTAIDQIFSKNFPLLTNSPGLVQIDGTGKIFLRVCNTGPTPITISKSEEVGVIKIVFKKDIFVIDGKAFVAAVSEIYSRTAPLLDSNK
jgi:hypothetical protein